MKFQVALAILNLWLGIELYNRGSLIVAALCLILALVSVRVERRYERRKRELEREIEEGRARFKTEYLRMLQMVDARRRSEAIQGSVHVRSDGVLDVSKSNVFPLRRGQA